MEQPVLVAWLAVLTVTAAAGWWLVGRAHRRELRALHEQLTLLTERLAAPVPAEPPAPRSSEFVITRLGEEPAPEAGPPVVPVVPAGAFADQVLRESVVTLASLAHGVRRALAPQTRDRIRGEMRREVKRSRRQRRSDLRTARREWEARQRAGLVSDEDAA